VITVLLVEDHASFRQALEAVMLLTDDLRVVASVQRGDEAGPATEAHHPDVAVVDLDLPGVGGTEAIAAIRRARPDTACVVLSGLTDDVELGRAIEAGGAAVLHKSVEMPELLDAIRQVAAGASLLPAGDTSRRLQALAASRGRSWHAQALADSLTAREREILGYLLEGTDGRIIARRLSISPETVQTHIRNLLAKLGVSTRLQAVVKAIKLGLVDPPA
jgi:DNA-binding NarL/FixJ family response regulator